MQAEATTLILLYLKLHLNTHYLYGRARIFISYVCILHMEIGPR